MGWDRSPKRRESGDRRRTTAGLGENRWLLTQPPISQALPQVEPAVTYRATEILSWRLWVSSQSSSLSFP